MAKKAARKTPKSKKKATKPAKKKPARKAPSKAARKPAGRKRPPAAKKAKPRPAKLKISKAPAPPPVPNPIGLQSQHIDFLTYKVDQVKKFYGDILGFKAEQRESDLNYLVIHTSPLSTLGFMPPHPQMTGEQPPPREPTLYFVVDDVDAIYAQLMAKGVAFMGPPQEMPWGDRVITTTDPEGRTVMLASRGEETLVSDES